jgi:hypothetical protein
MCCEVRGSRAGLVIPISMSDQEHPPDMMPTLVNIPSLAERQGRVRDEIAEGCLKEK